MTFPISLMLKMCKRKSSGYYILKGHVSKPVYDVLEGTEGFPRGVWDGGGREAFLPNYRLHPRIDVSVRDLERLEVNPVCVPRHVGHMFLVVVVCRFGERVGSERPVATQTRRTVPGSGDLVYKFCVEMTLGS